MNSDGEPSTLSNRGRPVNTRSCVLGLMTKYWESGQVKTRLGKSIGMDAAADLHRQFVLHLCEHLGSIVGRRTICLSPADSLSTARGELESVGLAERWQIVPQVEGDLGERMRHWFRTALTNPGRREHHFSAILIGSDCPMLSPAEIAEAADALQSNDVVIGPAYDGGYYLLGIAGPWQDERFGCLFESMPWSSDRVLAMTREQLKQSNLAWAELNCRHDVDTKEDLDRLRHSLASQLQFDRRADELSVAIERVLGRSPTQAPSREEQTP